ncbi:MAG: baseplate wedge protein 53 [Candidatus Pacebacteria bacterium]|nr:baseplate wedge protein 53 [Candidatus Paceibacterota bacterium]
MANYFRNIPNVLYDINGTEPNQYRAVTNIMKRVKFRPSVIENISDYYPYRVREGERPDIVSFQKYGTVAYSYLILLLNDIVDPLFDWPLHTRQFENYIIEKYGSISTAQTTNKYYYQIVRSEVARTGTSERIPEVKIIVDLTTYNTLDASVKSSQTVYDWEDELNDNKRDIKLINPNFIQDIDYEVKRTLSL